jgi:hypothetical protein
MNEKKIQMIKRKSLVGTRKKIEIFLLKFSFDFNSLLDESRSYFKNTIFN